MTTLPLSGDLLDRLADQGPHVVRDVTSGDRRDSVGLDAGTRAQLCEEPAEEGLAPLRVRDVLGRDASSLRRTVNDVLVDVVEAERVGDEPADVLASRTQRSRDAHDGRGHAATLGELPDWRQARRMDSPSAKPTSDHIATYGMA